MNVTIFQHTDFEGLYNPDNYIGAGAFGTVYKLKEIKTGNIFAVKILNGQDDSLLR